ncbi:MAG: putative quinol monooxygenase [Alcanivoracaceae bacterium]|jgi:quinol monooxygenase YgiN|nr:putative quinol monooxygenase [Alcanivoracaceae bacterium]
MIIVKGSIPVRTEDRPQALALVQELARESRHERGCLVYDVLVQADAPEVIVLWQQWSCIEALEEHFASSHVDAFLDAIPDFIEGEVTSARFEVQAFDGDVVTELVDTDTQPHVEYAEDLIVH